MNRIGDSLFHFGPNEQIVRGFVSAEVEFVVVGGLAVAWHCPNRQADDMDLLVSPTHENSLRISNVLADLHVSGHTAESFIKAGLQVPIKDQYYAELLTPERDGPTYAEIADSAVDAKLFGIPVRLASVASLVTLKLRAVAANGSSKEKHLRDLEMLRQASRVPSHDGRSAR